MDATASAPVGPTKENKSKEEYVFRGRAFIGFFRQVREYIESHVGMSDSKLLQYLSQKFPEVSANQIKRAIERVKTGKRRVSGTAPNLALCMPDVEMEYLNTMREKYGSKAGVVHFALRELMKRDPASKNVK